VSAGDRGPSPLIEGLSAILGALLLAFVFGLIFGLWP
jgi:hypothetical protein